MSKVLWTGNTIKHLSIHNRRVNPFNLGYGLEHAPFVLLYVVAIYYCSMSIGEPYAQALIEQNVTAEKLQARDSLDNLANADLQNGVNGQGSVAFIENEISLPNPYLPGLLPTLLLMGIACSHILLQLLQVWSLTVRSLVKYTPAKSVDEASFVRVTPKAFRGKACILPLARSASGQIWFSFQKRKYIAKFDNTIATFVKLKAPMREVIRSYVEDNGIQSLKELQDKTNLYGLNKCSIPRPLFTDMYKQQLLEPLTVFQLFSVFLWVLDEYWQYPLFTLAMILLFEGVTVMSRLKNLNTLRGMGNTNTSVKAFRFGKWQDVSSEEIVPGDLISLARTQDKECVVPCDALLLRGSAVINEATLTGESVPQMKESVAHGESELSVDLDVKTGHRVHTLFGGTSVLQHSAGESVVSDAVPQTPDGGCLLYVLRTGFSASQGKLVRMIEYSSGTVTASSNDALGLALLLLIFAILSASYVLNKGLEARGKITFELLLRCVLIITSVIPAELPMQTSLAVNTALISLVKKAIFCTEPFRIALAGKVDICLFDKTGTLTTDRLIPLGVVETKSSQSKDGIFFHPKPMVSSSLDTSIVLAGCHSLVKIDGKTVGDPVEESSMRAIQFDYDPSSNMAKPSGSAERSWNFDGDMQAVAVEILHRYHFTSKLQRMSVIAKVKGVNNKQHLRCLVKGSPESIRKILSTTRSSCPDWYEDAYQSLARQGMRVLALAYKTINAKQFDQLSLQPREWAESELTFAGFAAFRCEVRKDSQEIVKQLQASSHDVTMITGDAVLTAVHVAREVSIIHRECAILSLENDALQWKNGNDDSVICAYDPTALRSLAEKYDLCLSGSALLSASEKNDAIWKCLDIVRVFARMTPELKERVLISLKQCNRFTLMCGDGANDVGALKQAHIGVALLGGFGSANAGSKQSQDTVKTRCAGRSKFRKQDNAASSQNDLFNLSTDELKAKLSAKKLDYSHCRSKKELIDLLTNVSATTVTKSLTNPLGLTPEEKKRKMEEDMAEVERDVERRVARGESFARIRAMTAFVKKNAEKTKKQAQAKRGFSAHATQDTLNKYLDDFEDGEVPMVKLGDASIASPFTSRAPSVKGTIDIIRQGRCALVTTMQMYQILAVNCLISSYSLSVLYLDRVKYGNGQMVALGMISTVASLTLSRATPLDTLSPVRPLTSIFHPALFFSLMGQFALHLACMVYSNDVAKSYMEKENIATRADGKFVPNVMSTVVFLINCVQTVSVCAVNYKGRPFMRSMANNPGLLYSLGASFIAVFLAATEAMPSFNKALEIVVIPDQNFTRTMIGCLFLDVFGSFAWDQLCLFVFARHIFYASVQEMTIADIRQYVKMVVVSMVLIYFYANSEVELPEE